MRVNKTAGKGPHSLVWRVLALNEEHLLRVARFGGEDNRINGDGNVLSEVFLGHSTLRVLTTLTIVYK